MNIGITASAALIAAAVLTAQAAAQTTRVTRREAQAILTLNRMTQLQSRLNAQVSQLSSTELQNLLSRSSALQDSNLDGVPDVLAAAMGDDACTNLTGTGLTGTSAATAIGTTATGAATGLSTSNQGVFIQGAVTSIGQNTMTVGGQEITFTGDTIFTSANGQLLQSSDITLGTCAVVQPFQPTQTAAGAFQAARVQSVACTNAPTATTGTTAFGNNFSGANTTSNTVTTTPVRIPTPTAVSSNQISAATQSVAAPTPAGLASIGSSNG